MQSLDNVPLVDRLHFFKCGTCGSYYDARDFNEAMNHSTNACSPKDRPGPISGLILADEEQRTSSAEERKRPGGENRGVTIG